MIRQRTEAESPQGAEHRISQLLSETGPIADTLDHYEVRPQQADMADAVYRAFHQSHHLVVEAGTGVGKSFAYLVPAIEYIHEQGGKVLVSTYTITLQEQLLHKDLPILDACLSQGFTARLAKGRGNYICKRRLRFAMQRMHRLLGGFAEELRMIDQWAAHTEEGSLSELDFVPRSAVWDKIKSEHGNCRGRKCSNHKECFYWNARRELEGADIIVANHALLFSDLVLKQENYDLLPEFNAVVLDEAHTVERVAEEHFGLDISHRRVTYLLDGLYHPRRRRGLLTGATDNTTLINLVCEAHEQARAFFDRVNSWYHEYKSKTQGRCDPNFIDNTLSPVFKELRKRLGQQIKITDDNDEKLELTRYADMCHVLVQDLDAFLKQTHQDHIHWIESDSDEVPNIRLKSAPVHVGPYLRDCLFEPFGSVVLTSATLSTSGHKECNPSEESAEDGFTFFAGRIGLKKYNAVKLGSPFDYEQQVKVYIESTLPDPNQEHFVDKAAETIKRYLIKTQGRAFVLFTSYTMLEQMAEVLSPWLKTENITLLQQGGTQDRSVLLRRFKEDGKHVLFGTDSFWQGVDVPGEALSNVIIVRLPFAVPDHPLLAGRLEQIRTEGGNPFFDYQLPAAIIKFKQGFGRLIRSKTDQGIVVVLDSRIVNKRYGRQFLDSIPACRVEVVD